MKALFINCTLKKSPQKSNTQGLMEKSIQIMEGEGIETELIRPVDLQIEHSIDPNCQDDWAELYSKVLDADIVVIGSPIWLGNKSSVSTKIIERLYAHSAETNNSDQYIYYNKVGGVVVTGNEDGAKNVSKDLLYSLAHIGFTIPPQADVYWVGDAGPGPSYLEAGTGNSFTQKNTETMTWNLIHFARQLQKTPIPAQGNVVLS